MPSISLAWIIPGVVAWYVAAAVLTAGSTWRRRVGFAFALVPTVTPWLIDPSQHFVRAASGLILVMFTFRNYDLATMRPRGWSASRRVMHALSFIDTRLIQLSPNGVNWSKLPALAAFALGASVAAAGAVVLANRVEGPFHWVLRWFFGIAMLYCAADAVNALSSLGVGLLGGRVPELQRNPIAARSLAEFWGERWNVVVSVWLREHFFRPFAKRGHAAWGLVAAFAFSAFFHAYLAAAPGGALMALTCGSYFLIQAMLMIAERKLRVSRWNNVISAHAWTIATVVLPAPLLIEPFLRALFG